MDQFLTSWTTIFIIMHVFLLGVAYLILLERKIAAWTQDRVGPNRVGLGPLVRYVLNIVLFVALSPLLLLGIRPDPDKFWQSGIGKKIADHGMWGLGQPLADGLKFVLKEDYNPGSVDRGLFIAAPVLAVIPALLAWAVIPWGGVWESPWGELHIVGADVNIGVVYILAITSLSVYGIAVGSWAANNKYTFFGGIRGVAQILSYEIPLALTVLAALLLPGTVAADVIIHNQVDYWFGVIPQWLIFQQPVVAILFFVCILAETNRLPFDLAEAEQELIGGFHTEYSSMKFALFFLGEYMAMITGCAFFALLFLGGWHLPWIDYILYGGPQAVATGMLGVLLKVGVYMLKVLVLLSVMMWVRWSLPRFRFDQLMRLAWGGLIPISLAMLLTTGVFVYLDWTEYMWAGNIAVAAIVFIIAPLVPEPAPVNRRVGLRGSKYSPPAAPVH